MKPNYSPRSVWENPLHFIAFGFGSGAMPYAPGTFGTLAVIPFYLVVTEWVPGFLYFPLVVAAVAVGIWLCDITCKQIQVHDHPGVVFDEFVGFLVTMIFAPAGWLWIVVGFVLFRLFDIWKPFPIGWLDSKIGGGLGVMLDDIVAGLYAMVVLVLIVVFT